MESVHSGELLVLCLPVLPFNQPVFRCKTLQLLNSCLLFSALLKLHCGLLAARIDATFFLFFFCFSFFCCIAIRGFADSATCNMVFRAFFF